MPADTCSCRDARGNRLDAAALASAPTPETKSTHASHVSSERGILCVRVCVCRWERRWVGGWVGGCVRGWARVWVWVCGENLIRLYFIVGLVDVVKLHTHAHTHTHTQTKNEKECGRANTFAER
jgi:hypothetical protein